MIAPILSRRHGARRADADILYRPLLRSTGGAEHLISKPPSPHRLRWPNIGASLLNEHMPPALRHALENRRNASRPPSPHFRE